MKTPISEPDRAKLRQMARPGFRGRNYPVACPSIQPLSLPLTHHPSLGREGGLTL